MCMLFQHSLSVGMLVSPFFSSIPYTVFVWKLLFWYLVSLFLHSLCIEILWCLILWEIIFLDALEWGEARGCSNFTAFPLLLFGIMSKNVSAAFYEFLAMFFSFWPAPSFSFISVLSCSIFNLLPTFFSQYAAYFRRESQ